MPASELGASPRTTAGRWLSHRLESRKKLNFCPFLQRTGTGASHGEAGNQGGASSRDR